MDPAAERTGTIMIVMKEDRIERQAYHSGEFVSGHVDKELRPDVTLAITSAPLQRIRELVYIDGQSSVPTQDHCSLIKQADEIQTRCNPLTQGYALCRKLFAGTSQKKRGRSPTTTSTSLFLLDSVRTEVVQRPGKTITPKLHIWRSILFPACDTSVCLWANLESKERVFTPDSTS